MAERIEVVKLTRRPGFTFVHGGWERSDAQFCLKQIACLKGPKKRTADGIGPTAGLVQPKETHKAATFVGRVVQSLGWLPR